MMRYKILLSVLTCDLTALSAHAQTIVHDKQKEKQWRSMEDGPWDFAPDWYYYFLHKDYSGADKHWQWHGLESGFEIRFKEEDSNVKRIMPSRILSEETQRQKEKKVEEEMALLKELHDEEVARSVDRNVDLVYDTFKEDFERMQDAIHLREHRLSPQAGGGLRTGERKAPEGLRRGEARDGTTGKPCRTLGRNRHAIPDK